jgi:hypothetical protein
MGRRKDLGFYGVSWIELSLGELKSKFDELMAQKQEGKCIRINQIINFKRDHFGSCDMTQLGMTRNGMCGKLFQIKYGNGCWRC